MSGPFGGSGWPRGWSAVTALLVVATLAVVPAGSAAAAGEPVGEAVAAAKKKCKKGKVRVRVGKRRLCLPARRVLPKPRAGDPRVLLARSALGRDFSGLRNRRGGKAKSLPKLIRRLGPRATRLLQRVTAQGVARLDALAADAGVAGLGPRAWTAAGGCTPVPAGQTQRESFTSSDGGTRATVTATLGSEAGVAIELSGNGLTVQADLDFGACEPNEVEAPPCPTAAGRLEGALRYKLRASIRVSRGGENLWSQSVDITRRTRLEGFTDVDAKLDDLDIRDEEISTATVGGSTRSFPPISLRTRIIRKTRVNMRTGAYEPARSDISVTVTMEGLFGPERSEVEDDLERRARADADQQFRAIVDKAISGYRRRETEWQQPGKCAKLEFTPRPNTITLRARDTGSFSVIAKAVQDGAASELDARLENQEKAIFSPTRAGGQRARFNYTVASNATSGKVRVALRVTSKAGVAGTARPADRWEQPLVPPFEINRIEGNFSGTQSLTHPNGRTSNIAWTGHATWVRSPQGTPGSSGLFTLTGGNVTYTFSGAALVLPDCDMEATKPLDLAQPVNGGGGQVSVGAVGDPARQGPHSYTGDIFLGPFAQVTLVITNCDEEDVTIPVVQGGMAPLETQFQQSPDGIHFNGTRTMTVPGINVTTWNWTLTGSR